MSEREGGDQGARVVSVNVGRVGELTWRKKTHRTAIVKAPVEGEVRVGELGLEGDRQADPRVHGGPDKAVYLYPSEHYDFWRERLGRDDLAPGAFGENLTVTGLSEDDLREGDELEIGDVRLQVTEPRLPCSKLAARMQRADMQKIFVASERSGTYLRVLKAGTLRAGDPVRVANRPAAGRTVRAAFREATGRG